MNKAIFNNAEPNLIILSVILPGLKLLPGTFQTSSGLIFLQDGMMVYLLTYH